MMVKDVARRQPPPLSHTGGALDRSHMLPPKMARPKKRVGRGTVEVQVGPPVITMHLDDHVMVCEPNGHMSSGEQQGLFARDTRLVSGYRLKLGRVAPTLLNSSEVMPFSARFEFTNPVLDVAAGEIPAGTLHLRLDRTIRTGLHEDYDVTNHGPKRVEVELQVSIESDFADLFDVKAGRRARRGSLQSVWSMKREALTTAYENGLFQRGIEMQALRAGSPTEFANGDLIWRLSLEPGETWHTCLAWTLFLDGPPHSHAKPAQECPPLLGIESNVHRARDRWAATTTTYTTSDATITRIVDQAVDDLDSLRLHIHDKEAGSWGHGEQDLDGWIPAAGIPWFVSLFGRDALVVSLQTLSLSPRFALGALRALGRLQADSYDDSRDMQPGKIEHEIRHGELALLHLIPHTPYYGTHEATTLYVWTAAKAWRWHGDRAELDAVRPHVERALAWIDLDGDVDQDGLQEYKTRAKTGGYYNQGWKDSGEAIVDATGELASLPIALCEHQGYVVAAKREWARVLEDAYGDTATATRLRAEADRLVEKIEELFWWEEEGTYYLGLDGSKRPLRTVASNPAHLLWAGVVDPDRARRTATRLMEDDMWSGWGIRTLSRQHPSFNPFSYQLGAVWPHDNVIAAAGFRRYGLDDLATKVIRGIFDAADCFRSRRLPELFAGVQRDDGGFPTQYLGANVPQAWASGAVIHAMDVLLGLDADGPGQTLTVNPVLPPWLEEVRLENLGVGKSRANIVVSRNEDGSASLDVQHHGGLHVSLATEIR